MKNPTPIEYITDWEKLGGAKAIIEHIISHSERYEKERVFEAKMLIQKYKNENRT